MQLLLLGQVLRLFEDLRIVVHLGGEEPEPDVEALPQIFEFFLGNVLQLVFVEEKQVVVDSVLLIQVLLKEHVQQGEFDHRLFQLLFWNHSLVQEVMQLKTQELNH